MQKKRYIFISGMLILLVISAFFYLRNSNKSNIIKTEEKILESKREKNVKKMEEQLKILIEEQQKGQKKQEEILGSYEMKILGEKDKNRRVLLIKNMLETVGKYGIDASAIPILERIKEKIIDEDEKKIIGNKVMEIMKNRDMRAELEEYQKYNK